MKKEEITNLINATIKDNDSGLITAEVMRNVLNAINEGTGDGYTYIGTATPSTTPITLTGGEKVFYIATEGGDYSNFGLGTISELSIIKSDRGSWVVEGLGVPFDISEDILLSVISNLFDVNIKKSIIYEGDAFGGSTTIDIQLKAGDVILFQSQQAMPSQNVASKIKYNDGTEEYIFQGPVDKKNIVFKLSKDANKLVIYNAYKSINWKYTAYSMGVNDTHPFVQHTITEIAAKLLNNDGSIENTSIAWGVTDYIPVKAGEIFRVFATQFSQSVKIQYYNDNKEVIGVENPPNNSYYDFSIANDGYMRICYRRTQGYIFSLWKKYDTKKTIVERSINHVGMSIWWNDGKEAGGELLRGYQSLLRDYFVFKIVRNQCYSGYSLGMNSGADSSSLINTMTSWVASDNDIWTLDTITNDFKRNIPIGSIDDYTNNTGGTTYYGALRIFLDKVNSLTNNPIVIVASGLRRNNGGYTSDSQNTHGHTMTDYSLALQNIASKNGWYFIDQFNSEFADNNIPFTTYDGLHLNNYGYRLAIKKWVEQLDIIAKL